MIDGGGNFFGGNFCTSEVVRLILDWRLYGDCGKSCLLVTFSSVIFQTEVSRLV